MQKPPEETSLFRTSSLLTIRDNSLNGSVLLRGDVADDREGEDSHQETRERVHEGHGQSVVQDVVAELVVAREGDHGTEGDPHRVESL